MGAFSNNTPRLLWLCTIVACLILIVNSYQVSADSKLDTDLVFDSLEQTNLKNHENHPRIEREISIDDETNLNHPVEEEYWLTNTVNRLKRSISNLFNKNEERSSKVNSHHTKINKHHPKKVNVNQSKSQKHNKRKHRQTQEGQQEAQEDYDDDALNGSIDNNGGIGIGTWSDDEDDLEVNSGEGGSGGAVTSVDLTTPAPVDYGHPRVYRFSFTVVEPYVGDFNDRNSNTFQNLASRIKRAIEDLYQSIPGEQYASVISIQEIESDPFKVKVTVDVDSNGYYYTENIKSTVYNQIENNHRIGNLTITPENFYFREFEETQSKCESYELQCRSGQCVPIESRCNDIRDCNDNTDEAGCDEEDHTEVIPIEPDLVLAPGPIPRISTEAPVEGSGEDCRADDAVRCSDGSRSICADQICDSIRDCDDGGDELNCGKTKECAVGEFTCDVNRCIPVTQRCDGTPDCTDGTDEHSCVPVCTPEEHQCDEKCISRDLICNRIPDCRDGSDEQNCQEPQCQPDEFVCGDRGECIPDYLRCDGTPHCRNGFDELNCTRPDEVCALHCNNKCIPDNLICDGKADCDDNSDESDCPPPHICPGNQMTCKDGFCIDNRRQCDGVRDCPDGSDEEECPCGADQFQCSYNGQCIDPYLRCNGRNDCSDGSDEYNCPIITTTLSPETTRSPISCPIGYHPCNSLRQCIRSDQLCDGRADCNDLSDELNCYGPSEGLDLKTYPNSQEIKENREVVFQCRDEGQLRAKVYWARPNGQPLPEGSVDRNGRLEIPNIRIKDSGTYLCIASGYPPNTPGAQVSVDLRVDRWDPLPIPDKKACQLDEATCSNGQCIPKMQVCDGKFDCADGSDEIRCNPNGCEPNEYQCANKKCVLKTWRCDADDDCGDGSDEDNCGTTPPGALCQYHQFACHSNNQCIPKSYHCDAERDCIDGSDEIGCSKPVISRPPPPKVILDVGDTLNISCTAVGIPIPEIVWRLNWGHIPPKCRTTSVNGFGELVCEDMQVENQGAYSCEVLNIKGTVFAVPDTIVVVERNNPCKPGYFNDKARSDSECIKCFCFGQTSNCRSADLFIYQFQPPFDSLKLLGVRIDPYTGVVDIRDEPIFRGAQSQLIPVGSNGVHSTAPEYAELSQSDVLPYFAMPENYHGNQLKSYGGYLRYTVRHSNRGYPTPGPSVIISGNGYILLHQSSRTPSPNTNEDIQIRFFEGEWIKKSDREPETIASREQIMMVLED